MNKRQRKKKIKKGIVIGRLIAFCMTNNPKHIQGIRHQNVKKLFKRLIAGAKKNP